MPRPVNLITSAEGKPIDIFKPDFENVVNVTSPNPASSSATALPTRSAIVRISADGDVAIKFGDDSVTCATTDVWFSAGHELWTVEEGATHFATRSRSGSDQNVQIVCMV